MGITQWLARLKQWINRLFGKRTTTVTNRILRTEISQYVVIRQIEVHYEDEMSVRLRCWRAVPKDPDAKWDILLFCDRLKRTESARRRGDIGSFVKTHRFTVMRISRAILNGKQRTDLLLLADLDCVKPYMMNRGLDGCSFPIIDSLALQLKHRETWDLKMLTVFEDDRGVLLPNEKWAVTQRWKDCLLYYHGEYCEAKKPFGN